MLMSFNFLNAPYILSSAVIILELHNSKRRWNVMNLFQTLLFAPANHDKKVKKALNLPIDVVIIDLEDACAIEEKEKSRGDVRHFLKLQRQCKAYVRVNAISTPFFHHDMITVASPDLDGIVLPKTESAEDILVADWLLSSLEKEHKLPIGTIDLLPIIETAKGISNLKSIL
jgi:citrate lyase subunit beta/citryl-CoA lyase